MGGVEFWINHPDFQLIQPADPNATAWCPESVEMVEWGDTLLSRVAADPAPGKIAFAQHKLLIQYAKRYHKAPHDHRAETNLDNHPCLHQALIAIADKLEDIELAAGIPELSLPVPQTITPTPEHPVVDGHVVSGPPVEEESGIDLGDAEDEDTGKQAPA